MYRYYHNLLIFLDKAKCYCQNKNGGPWANGIMCNTSGLFEITTVCNNYQWCTGPATNNSAIIGTAKLCEHGKTYKSYKFHNTPN